MRRGLQADIFSATAGWRCSTLHSSRPGGDASRPGGDAPRFTARWRRFTLHAHRFHLKKSFRGKCNVAFVQQERRTHVYIRAARFKRCRGAVGTPRERRTARHAEGTARHRHTGGGE
ncbi:hypothetical protein EYF80_049888 [Liparis tanakae]|uniref:Uncharacterized protein n=1 Tax=Liparis tanakae TaxID=230148 RepID=A0A4Z2FI28_9TELE|nr:hypothetical protein EYF80_049888 [Liparis tanakae]